jgi:tetratricopeptide (TPR) repeat protein
MSSKFNFLVTSSLLLMTSGLPVKAEIERWQELQKDGQEAFDAGKFKKAEQSWSKAVREATRTEVGDKNLSLSLKKLAEADISLHKYREGEARLQRAIKINKELGDEDPETIRDLLELAKTYRSVNLEQFGKVMETLFKQSGLNKIEIFKTRDGNSRIQIRFADKFTKRITSADVDRINLDKTVTFDIHEDKAGVITLSNIKGLKIRSHIWVALTASSIDPSGDEGKPVATVTAKKLGLTKTVQTVLPKQVYDRILTAVERIKHPELHSPWYKALQDKFKGLLHPLPTAAESAKEVADKVGGTPTENGSGTQTGKNMANAKPGESTDSGAEMNKSDSVSAGNADVLKLDKNGGAENADVLKSDKNGGAPADSSNDAKLHALESNPAAPKPDVLIKSTADMLDKLIP